MGPVLPRSRLECTVGYWLSGLKFEKNCVPPQDVNSHNLGFVYLEASVNVYSTEEYVSRMLILQRRSDRCFQCIMTRRMAVMVMVISFLMLLLLARMIMITRI